MFTHSCLFKQGQLEKHWLATRKKPLVIFSPQLVLASSCNSLVRCGQDTASLRSQVFPITIRSASITTSILLACYLWVGGWKGETSCRWVRVRENREPQPSRFDVFTTSRQMRYRCTPPGHSFPSPSCRLFGSVFRVCGIDAQVTLVLNSYLTISCIDGIISSSG